MPLNPFKVKAARKLFEEKGLGVGDYVRISWSYDKAYGTGTAHHEGVISELDDWVRVEESPRAPGYLHLPITAVIAIEGIEVEKTHPSLRRVHADEIEPEPADAPAPTNPFIAKAKTQRRIPGKS